MTTQIQLSPDLDAQIARFTRSMVGGVLGACDPFVLMSAVDFSQCGPRTHFLGFGKASAGMAKRCVHELGSRLAGGVVLTPAQHIPKDTNGSRLNWFGVDHPLPTPRNVEATNRLVKYVRSIPSTDECLVCISGGGSAHLCSPMVGVSLEEIIDTIRSLNAHGATIHEINRARRQLETLKGGGLARMLKHVSQCRALVLSDVLDDDLATIASGPMLSLEFPIEHTIVGNHTTAFDEAESILRELGIRICSLSSRVSGDSAAVGAGLASRFVKGPDRGAHLIAGETTVDTQGGTGIGGPTLELVLSAAVTLAQSETGARWIALGLATDGIDGPSMAAGAVITNEMLGIEQVQSAQQALNLHDSMRFIESIGGLMVTGATGTNVNDLALVGPFEMFRAMQ